MCNEIFAELREMLCSILSLIVLIYHLSCLFPDSEFNYHACHITGFVTTVTQRAQSVEQELITLPEDLGSFPVSIGCVLLNLQLNMSLLRCVTVVTKPVIWHAWAKSHPWLRPNDALFIYFFYLLKTLRSTWLYVYN
jgi:hypothetical protein